MRQPLLAGAPSRRRVLVLAAIAVLVLGGTSLYLAWRMDMTAQEQLAEIDRLLQPQRQAWRAQKDQEMQSELSPLGRVDYVHLRPGENRLGAEVPLPAGVLPDRAAVRLLCEDGRLRLHATPAVPVGGQQKQEAELKNGDVVAVGRARLLVVGLPADPSLAVYDLEAPARRAYQGLRYFPDDSRYAVVGQLDRYPQPRPAQLEASRGEPQRLAAVGTVRFEVAGVPSSLEAYDHGAGMLFLLFKDQTNGKPDGSYGAGRFLYARINGDGKVLLDFNQAWNPLCAYSKYFHCPLPPKQNWLRVAIPVGERDYAPHGGDLRPLQGARAPGARPG